MFASGIIQLFIFFSKTGYLYIFWYMYNQKKIRKSNIYEINIISVHQTSRMLSGNGGYPVGSFIFINLLAYFRNKAHVF